MHKLRISTPPIRHGTQVLFEQAYITAITNLTYYKGLKVLVKSLKKTNTKIPLFVMLPSESDDTLKSAVEALGVNTLECESIRIAPSDESTNIMEHWNQTFFKLNIMRLTKFKKIIFIDADMLIINNIDHLFQYPSISAATGGKAAHPEWTEFNSGLMVLEPDKSAFEQLIRCINPAIERRRSLGLGYGDQDVFNQFYPEWHSEPEHHLDEGYNAECCFLDVFMKTRQYQHLAQIHVLHFIGTNKIWNNTLLKNIRIIRGCFFEKKYFEAYAHLLYLRYLYL